RPAGAPAGGVRPQRPGTPLAGHHRRPALWRFDGARQPERAGSPRACFSSVGGRIGHPTQSSGWVWRRSSGMRGRARALVLLAAALVVSLLPPAATASNAPSEGGVVSGGSSQSGRRAGGDFNGDGFSDLAIGAPFEDVGRLANAGAVNVLYGALRGLHANGIGGPDDQFWFQGHDGVDDHPEAGDHFGWSLASGDFNGDGYSDLAIGVPHEDVRLESNHGIVVDAGAVNVLYGSPTGLQTSSPADQFWS